MSAIEEKLLFHIKAAGLPEPEREYRFDAVKRYRFDFAYPDQMLAIEVEGGTWIPNTGHTSGVGYQSNVRKYNLAVVKGWKLLRFTTDMVTSGEAIMMIEAVLNAQ